MQKGQGDDAGRAPGDDQRRRAVRAGDPLYGDGRKTLSLPAFLDDTAVQKVYLCAFVPPTQDVVGTAGSWAEDFEWRWGNQDRWIPVNSESHEKKVEWVCEGNSAALGAAKTFHFDGTPLIFSTLRPDAQANVRLWTVDHQTLNAWIFGVVVLGGVVLVLNEPGASPDRRGRVGRRPGAAGRLLADALAARPGRAVVRGRVHRLAVLGGRGTLPAVSAAHGLWRIGTTWSAWVASRKAMVPKRRRRPRRSRKPRRPTEDGGASHG